jgi:DHA2 family multidrug resistance protein
MTNSLQPSLVAQAAAAYQHALRGFFGPANSAYRAQASVYQQLGRQALAWAFVDAFRWLALLCFACVGFVWLLKRVRPAKGAIAAH